jgi:squalene-hopene/tetraprenyl-beta-curcumene cyclase
VKTLCKLFFLIVITLMLIPTNAAAAERIVAGSKSDISFRNEVENAIGKGLTWLASKQSPDGSWSEQEYPAMTGLVLTAFQGDPSGFYKRKYEQTIRRGYEQILKCVKPDGSIYVKDLANYNTSVCTMALVVANRPEYEEVIKKARHYLIGLQDDQGEPGMGDSPFDGGIGYGGRYQHSDLSNTVFALEAIHYTKYLKNEAGKDFEAKDLNWQAAIQFISRTQNLPGYNDQKWASDDPDNKGGFIYFPGDDRAVQVKLPDGKVALRSYGSMSYAGLLSYIYADLDKNDPRVKAVYEWLTNHYTLDENPGMEKQGLFYYYHTMAKALNLYGVPTLKLKNGKTVNWRYDLAKRLLDMQNGDGYWANENGRWMEKDPVLVTSYSLLILEIIWRGL